MQTRSPSKGVEGRRRLFDPEKDARPTPLAWSAARSSPSIGSDTTNAPR
jgi:hypothetical protein